MQNKPPLARATSRKMAHFICLLLGGLVMLAAALSVLLVRDVGASKLEEADFAEGRGD